MEYFGGDSRAGGPKFSGDDDNMGYMHFYPWQTLTRSFGVEVSHKLDRVYNAEKLHSECERILKEYPPANQHGKDHDGGWKAISLVALGGDPYEDHIAKGEFKKTRALDLAPYMNSIIEDFPCQTRRVRLMQLLPDENIYWHFDPDESLDEKNVRLHVPIITNPDVQFQISHQDCRWLPGQLWYGDFTFPHRLWNGGKSPRIHLVMDFVIDDFVRNLFPLDMRGTVKTRRKVRKTCQRMCRLYTIRRYGHLDLGPYKIIFSRKAGHDVL